MGLFERLTVGAFLAWVCVVSVLALTKQRRSNSAGQHGRRGPDLGFSAPQRRDLARAIEPEERATTPRQQARRRMPAEPVGAVTPAAERAMRPVRPGPAALPHSSGGRRH